MRQNSSERDIVLRLRQRLPQRPIMVLSKVPDPNSHFLDFQTYIVGGEEMVPLFSSPEALRASTRGADLGRPLYEIERSVIVNVLKHHKVVIFLLDPQTEGELRFTLDDLREAFPEVPAA